MALEFNVTNFVYIFTYFSPLILSSFMVLSSAFNQDVKGLFYLGGILVLIFASILIRNITKIPNSPNRSPICKLVDIPFMNNRFEFPIDSTLIIGYTMLYLMTPMMAGMMNIPVIVSLILLTSMDIYVNASLKCGNIFTIVMSLILGAGMGTGWFYVMNAISPDFVYFADTPSNRVVCQKPKANTYKCKVYKNGRLIKTV